MKYRDANGQNLSSKIAYFFKDIRKLKPLKFDSLVEMGCKSKPIIYF
jgi:hypothetical protein